MIGRIYHLRPADMGDLRPWQLDAIADDMKQLAAAAREQQRG